MPHAHPAAPTELKGRFAGLVESIKTVQSSQLLKSNAGVTGAVFEDFWEAPQKLWHPKLRNLGDVEIAAVMSGGASLSQSQ
ncbi:hypothetical protein AX17_006032 [Amanita inopinata Kibby_2008]|nr:hypothetical protein AX17_006032 [Amanita inopinata Kibby_2008]